MPRPNGYSRMHTSVIRSAARRLKCRSGVEMHRMAEEGIAAHWKMQEGRAGDQRDERYFRWIASCSNTSRKSASREFIQEQEGRALCRRGVRVPAQRSGQGPPARRGSDRLRVRRGARTPTSAITASARVNGKMVPLRTHLKTATSSDRDGLRPQAEPRLAQLRRHVTRALRDQYLDSPRGAVRAIDPPAGRCSRRKRAGSISISRRHRGSRGCQGALVEFGAPHQARRDLRARRLRQARAEAVARQAGAARTRCRRRRLKARWPPPSRRVFGTRAKRRSRSPGIDDIAGRARALL